MKKDIYIIKNKINNKVYIGQADFAANRWLSHIKDAKYGPKILIDKAIRKYGIENFWYELLENQISDYDEKEKYWIKQYNSQIPNGYNVSPGGAGIGAGIECVNSKIKSLELLLLIINDIKEGELTFEQIGKKYQLGSDTIVGINKGKYYHLDNQTYPLREYFLSEERFKRLVYSLKYELDKTIEQIAIEFDLHPSTVSDINQGKQKHVDWVEYPLRQGKVTNPLYNNYKEIQNLLQNTTITFQELARKYNVAVGSIQSINEGGSWKDETLDYPLRKGGNPSYKNFSQDQIKEIENLLANSNLSIIKIAEKFNCNKTTICNINRGKVKKYFNENIKYPIRHK